MATRVKMLSVREDDVREDEGAGRGGLGFSLN